MLGLQSSRALYLSPSLSLSLCVCLIGKGFASIPSELHMGSQHLALKLFDKLDLCGIDLNPQTVVEPFLFLIIVTLGATRRIGVIGYDGGKKPKTKIAKPPWWKKWDDESKVPCRPLLYLSLEARLHDLHRN
uniref:Uncharacterized protein n=1 Tax=Coccidioides posadasii RMSCC 3488 TaxID=454284 RepID=A0A0J6IJR8_COCPO|nr:hypothetical protein CPAG_08446 [Coccidioides posadasii RMSCC 3488]